MPLPNIAAILTAIDATQYLGKIVSGYTEYKQVAEQERTKRREIAAWERTTTLGGIVSSYREYQQVAEQERTKRREIDTWEKETIAKINAQRDLLMTYLERSFDERAENFRSLFCVVDRAIAAGNNDQLALALHSITEIAKSSPFKELANLASVRAALDDPDHEWTF
jgi:ribonucleotide reductase alpha subunit